MPASRFRDGRYGALLGEPRGAATMTIYHRASVDDPSIGCRDFGKY